MSRKLLFCLLSILIAMLAASCAPECTINEYDAFFPILLSPQDGALISYDNPPTFDWTHEEACSPEFYLIHFEREDGPSTYNLVEGDTTKFTKNHDFSPGFTYSWYVETVGYFQSEEPGGGHQTIYGPKSQTWTFTTDGRCSAAELVPPVLKKPQNEKWLGDYGGYGYTSVNLKWDYPGDCYPEYYQYQLASDPEFKNIISTGFTEWNKTSTWISVPGCSRIYWRVAARTGNASGGYSDPFRFTFALDYSCWQNQTSIDAALIKGFVFDDFCAATTPWIPEGVGINPPCVFGEPYGVHADGNRARGVDGEPGIPDVVVDLGAGPCPSTGLDERTTAENGAYYFLVQAPGVYCVSVDMDKNPALDHGIWTRPLTNERITEYTITLEESDDLIIESFGWDKNDFIKIDWWVNLNSFCRAGDTINHLALAVAEEGSVIPLFRRNEEGTWFETIVDGIPCLISIESGEAEDDTFKLPVFEPYPDPEPPPDSQDKPSGPNCSRYTDIENCNNVNGCTWTLVPGVIPIYKCLAD